MSIKFRCEHCRKTVKAPNDAAGRRGKCPYCNQSSYIPRPVSEDELVPLAPLDENEERKLEEERRKLFEQDREVLAERSGEMPVPLEHRENITPEDLHHFVVNYCLDLAQSNLQRAAYHADKLRPYGTMAHEAVQDFRKGRAQEPVLKEIPAPVLKGFLDKLDDALKAQDEED